MIEINYDPCLTSVLERQRYIEDNLEECQRAFRRYRDKHWRCEARDTSGRWRCQNYWEGHDKGHQFTRDDRPLPLSITLRVGEFKCSFEPKATIDLLHRQIRRIH